MSTSNFKSKIAKDLIISCKCIIPRKKFHVWMGALNISINLLYDFSVLRAQSVNIHVPFASAWEIKRQKQKNTGLLNYYYNDCTKIFQMILALMNNEERNKHFTNRKEKHIQGKHRGNTRILYCYIFSQVIIWSPNNVQTCTSRIHNHRP